MKFQNIENFDDVHWAKLSDGRVVIYELAITEDRDDTLIIPTGLQIKGVELLEKRMGFSLSIGKTMEDDPITLKDGTEITPVLTNRDAAYLRLRQKGMPLPR
jgi:hypothetical protein